MERKQIEMQADMAIEEKKKLLGQIENKEEEHEKAMQQQRQLLKKLKNMEDKVLIGDKLMEEAQRQQVELRK